MTEDAPSPKVTGRLPRDETASADRIGRVSAGDLDRASPLDLAGMVLVTSCVSTRFGLPDLIAEAASAGLIRPAAVRFRSPLARLGGPPVIDAQLLAETELDELRRFVDGTLFRLVDGDLRAYLHAVAVALPGEPTGGVPEPLWTAARTGWLAGRLAGVERDTDPPPAPLPPAVVLWAVGLESRDGRGVRLQSGFVATLDRH